MRTNEIRHSSCIDGPKAGREVGFCAYVQLVEVEWLVVVEMKTR